MTDLENRYQCQPFYIKVCRWLRWKPITILKAVWRVIWWYTCGGVVPKEDKDWFSNRWDYVKMIWRISMSDASYKMKHYYTMEEVMAELRIKIDSIKR